MAPEMPLPCSSSLNQQIQGGISVHTKASEGLLVLGTKQYRPAQLYTVKHPIFGNIGSGQQWLASTPETIS